MNKPTPKTIALSILIFMVFVILLFPWQNFRGKLFSTIYDMTKVTVNSEDMSLTFIPWPGIKLSNVDVDVPMGDSGIDIHSEKVIFRVGLGSIFPPSLALSLNIKSLKKGGNIYTSMSPPGSELRAYVDADDVDLSQIHFSSLSTPIQGIMNLIVDLDLNNSDLAKSNGKVEINGKKLKTPSFLVPMSADYGFTIPALTLGDLKGNISIKNGIIEIPKLQFGANGTDLEGALTGEIRLGRSWQTSFVNLSLRFKLSDACKKNPQSATLVSFINTFHSDKTDSYGMKCSASIQDITTHFACAIPEKLPD